MHHLYKAYACEDHGDGSKILLPGYPVPGKSRRPQPGEPLHLELADGTRLQTQVVNTQYVNFADSAAERLRTKPGFYCAVTVPTDFDPPGITLGADVYLE